MEILERMEGLAGLALGVEEALKEDCEVREVADELDFGVVENIEAAGSFFGVGAGAAKRGAEEGTLAEAEG